MLHLSMMADVPTSSAQYAYTSFNSLHETVITHTAHSRNILALILYKPSIHDCRALCLHSMLHKSALPSLCIPFSMLRTTLVVKSACIFTLTHSRGQTYRALSLPAKAGLAAQQSPPILVALRQYTPQDHIRLLGCGAGKPKGFMPTKSSPLTRSMGHRSCAARDKGALRPRPCQSSGLR